MKKHHITLNKFFNISLISGILLFLTCISLHTSEEDTGITVALIIVSLFLMICPLFATPCCYLFDDKGVTICYVFYSNERYLWKNIYRIQSKTDSDSYSHPLFDLLFSGVYEIGGSVEGRAKFYMHGHISKGFRAKKLIQKYWDGEITKEFDFTAKKKKREQHLSADQANEAERAVRMSIRKWQTPIKEKAERSGYELRSNYLYVTNDLYEYKSRPNQAYTFTYEAEICRLGETNENKIAFFSIELLHARAGKNSWHCVESRDIDKELECISKEAESIFAFGIEKYFE